MNTILSLLRIIGVLLSLFLLFIFIMPMTVRVINVGNIAGVIFAVWLFCVSCRPVQSFFSRIMHQNGFLTFLYRAVNTGFTAFAVYGIIITCFMALACNSKPADNSTLIVLGAQVRPEGVPSLILRGRINAAEKYLDEHREAKAVLAGGMGFDEPMSEAKCMYDTMVEDGISPDRLIMEDKSKNTMENFRYSREVLADNDLGEDITVTTDGFHTLRAMLIVRQQGFKGRVGAVCAETRLEFLPTYVVREWFALPFQLIR
ncbi:MAG: YdcF family protein [Eubacteriales bacterium]|nr:YdcF family protein [Eubacteriales bacterium]